MIRRHLPLLSTLLILICIELLLVVALKGGDTRSVPRAGQAACRYEATAGIPSWVTSGVSLGGRLLVVDVHKGSLVEISGRAVAEESRAALGDFVAGSIRRVRQGVPRVGAAQTILLELAGGRLFEVDRSLTPRRKIEITTTGLESQGTQIAMLLDWIPLEDGQVFGYADLSAGDVSKRVNWRNGFVRFDPNKPESFRVVSESLYPDDERTSILVYSPLMASIGSTAFVSRINGNAMSLWRLDPLGLELQQMRAFPEHLFFRLAPMLPHFATIEEYLRTMEASETANMPAGLFAWDNALFLLSRTFEHDQRRWYISKIDPVRDRMIWTVRVPGSAHHMIVIPGDQEWAFLERGPIAEPMIQTTHHIRFVSSTQMRSAILRSLCG